MAYYFIFLISYIFLVHGKLNNFGDEDVLKATDFVYWPNATIPFFINSEHFDAEQKLSILTSLSLLAFKTCLKINPVMSEPSGRHVLVIENPNGVRKCVISKAGHSSEEPHRMTLGYDCLKSPQIDMMMMRALGFSFEHNRASRDIFVDVIFENIQPDAIDLFTKDKLLPRELINIRYDVDSVMHFGERDFSKNGHRTIIFKNRSTKQNRAGFSDSDLRKIEVVYGPECQKRDRQEKIELCRKYPNFRRKRDVSVESIRSLRVNPEITAPPELPANISETIKNLDLTDEVNEIVQKVHMLTATALKNARVKYCNGTKDELRSSSNATNVKPDVLGIVELVAAYTENVVENAIANMTEFCQTSETLETYLRASCSFYDSNNGRCRQYFRSTKSGAVKHSTQHRPTYYYHTRHEGRTKNSNFLPIGYRAREDNETLNERIVSNITDIVNANESVKLGPQASFQEEVDSKILVRKKRPSENVTNNTNGDDRVSRRKRDTDEVKGKPTEDNAHNVTVKNNESQVPDNDNGMKIPVNDNVQKDTNDDELLENGSNDGDKAVLRMVTQINADKKRRFMRDRIRNIQNSRESTTEKYNRKRKERERKQRYEEERFEDYEESASNGQSLEIRKRDKGRPHTIEKVKLSKKNEEFYNERKWPEGIVRYVIKDSEKYDIEDIRTRLAEVNSILKEKTCASLEEITESETERFEDYLVLDNSPDYVTGRVGGRQSSERVTPLLKF
ncbi:unnamed protein product [Leptidea sinapis]|uniref:Metalloendopeptidase n=1 Tax=Leptidea sinapis TaxID=189913 RepID=A0A5E4PZU7_9NEOP|nr:unnamed protein product [Leptidea sinapis]